MPLLDRLFGSPDSLLSLNDVPSIADARITALGNNSSGGSTLALRLPDTTRSGRLQSAVSERLFGAAGVDDKTNPTTLNFDQSIVVDDDGNFEIDFTQFGGKKFSGTMEELTSIQGQELFDLVGSSAFQQSNGGTLSLDDIRGRPAVGTRPSAPPPARTPASARSTVQAAQATQRRRLVQPAEPNVSNASGLELDDLTSTFQQLPDALKIGLLQQVLQGEQ